MAISQEDLDFLNLMAQEYGLELVFDDTGAIFDEADKIAGEQIVCQQYYKYLFAHYYLLLSGYKPYSYLNSVGTIDINLNFARQSKYFATPFGQIYAQLCPEALRTDEDGSLKPRSGLFWSKGKGQVYF